MRNSKPRLLPDSCTASTATGPVGVGRRLAGLSPTNREQVLTDTRDRLAADAPTLGLLRDVETGRNGHRIVFRIPGATS